MAYFFDPNSYANTLYGAPPFMRRRPSPPPMTCYPREAADPYVRALAEEQAARTALQDAIKREREARQRRAEEEAKAKLRERARQRPHTMYGGYSPNAYGYPGFGYGQSYPDNDYGYCGGDDDMEYEYSQYSPFFAPPRREAMKRQFQSVPRTARSQSRWPTQKERTPSPKPPSPDLGPKISIPISSPSPKPSKPLKPEASPEEQNAAASKIQSAYRVHHALNSIKSAREKFDSLMSSFTMHATLEFDLSSPPKGGERPKLTYSKTNAPVHVHEDSLIKLLQTLDAVESHGDRTVREKRRELVKEIEKELERIDAEIRRQYEGAKLQTDASMPPSDMEVEPESRPSAEDISTSTSKEVKMDEDVEDKPVDDSSPGAAPVTTGAADVISSQPVSEPTVPAQPVASESAMEIEPSDQSTHIQVPVAISEVPIADEDPRTTTAPNDSSPESDAEVETELKTPQFPDVSLPISQPIIQSADSPLPGQVGVQEIHPDLRDASESVENTKMQVHESVETPAQTSPSRRKVTIEDEDEATEKDYVVL